MLKMDRYTDKKITSIAIQLKKLGIDFIHFYKYDFASNHIGKEPGVEIDWFFQNSILFTETVHKFPDELNIEEFIFLYKNNLLSKQDAEYFYNLGCEIYTDGNCSCNSGYEHIREYYYGRFSDKYKDFKSDFAVPIAVRKVDTKSNFANSLLPILFGKRIVLEDCSLDLCYFENMNLVIPIEKYFKKSMNIYDLKKCDGYKEGTWSLNDLIEYIKLKKLSEQNEQKHMIDNAHNNIMDILENEESDAKVRTLHK